jgi:hypothetical protein
MNNTVDCKSYLFQYFNCQGVANHWKYLTEEGAFPNCRENIKSKKRNNSKNRISKMYE